MPYKDPDKDRECKRQWYLRNKERLSTEAKQRYASDPEPAKKRTREWNKANTERHRENARRYRAEHHEKCLEQNRQYYQENRNEIARKAKEGQTEERRLAKSRYDHERYLADPESMKRRVREWREQNPAKATQGDARKRAIRNAVKVDPQAQEYITALVNDPCCYCGSYDDWTLDHIESYVRGGVHNWENLTAACRSCNSSKNDDPLLRFLLRRG